MPLDEHIEGGHGKRESRLKIRPDTMHNLLEMADEGQHRQHRFDEDALLPLSPSTEFEIAWIALRRMKGHITQDNHLLFTLPHEPLKGVICDIRCGTVPCDDQAILVHHQT